MKVQGLPRSRDIYQKMYPSCLDPVHLGVDVGEGATPSIAHHSQDLVAQWWHLRQFVKKIRTLPKVYAITPMGVGGEIQHQSRV
ncbi:hypothetical protein SERLA73DRAFT_130794, partial [Serpula lacrymans var. lacrymans S7.3]